MRLLNLFLESAVQMVHESLINQHLTRWLKVIKTEGEYFHPNIHQAVVQDDNPDSELLKIDLRKRNKERIQA